MALMTLEKEKQYTDPLNGAEHLIVVDLEATCCNNGTIARDEMEIIEIGAVLVDGSDLSVEEEFQTFIRPVRRPELTEFCTELTAITQEMVDDAPDFPEAVQAFKDWMNLGEHHATFGSWGDYDRKQFMRDCRYHRIGYPMPPHINLKEAFSSRQKQRKRYGMAGALKLCGLKLDGTHHRGIDDARNIAKLLPWIVGDRKI